MTNLKQRIVRLSKIVLIVLLILIISNLPVSTKQGINYQVRPIKMPLYIKIIEFLDRDYHYKKIAKEVIQGYDSDEKKVLALFNWTHTNIRKAPKDFLVFDDHILNIIIRGYGEDDQSADVFNTLCVYSGIPAMRVRLSPKNSKAHIDVSVVNIDGKLSIFDTYRGHYFINEEEKIASLEEIINRPSLIKQQTEGEVYHGIEYARFFEDTNSIKEIETVRGREQMPIQRILSEIKGIFKR